MCLLIYVYYYQEEEGAEESAKAAVEQQGVHRGDEGPMAAFLRHGRREVRVQVRLGVELRPQRPKRGASPIFRRTRVDEPDPRPLQRRPRGVPLSLMQPPPPPPPEGAQGRGAEGVPNLESLLSTLDELEGLGEAEGAGGRADTPLSLSPPVSLSLPLSPSLPPSGRGGQREGGETETPSTGLPTTRGSPRAHAPDLGALLAQIDSDEVGEAQPLEYGLVSV